MKFTKWVLPVVIVVPVAIGGLFFALTNDSNLLFGCISAGTSIAILLVYVQQNSIQNSNIKVQLFDKRYKVYQCVLDTIIIIKRDNWDRYILFKEENNSNKQMIELEENLHEATMLSKRLFSSDIYETLVQVNNMFCKVMESYKQMVVKNMELLSAGNDTNNFVNLYKGFLLSENEQQRICFEEQLKMLYTDVYTVMNNFSRLSDKYLDFVQQSNILDDIGKYIKVDKLG